jgi:nucleoside 2-deoxyribosyltransferase
MIYIAGALFTPGERRSLEEVALLCEQAGWKTYLPHRDGGILEPDRANAPAVFKADLDALDQCELVVAVLQAEVDSGTAWEMGYAFRSGKNVFILCEDFRIQGGSSKLNPMLTESSQLFGNREALRAALTSARESSR